MKLYKLVMSAFLITLLTGCEKGIDLIDVENTVYIPQAGYSSQTALLGESTFGLSVYKAGIGKGGSVNVTVGVDEAALEEFKTNNKDYADYTILPQEYYSLESENLSIAESSYESFVNIKLKGIGTDFKDTKYILPVAIKSASEGTKINEEKSVAFIHFNRYRNVYEGLYKAYGSATDNKGNSPVKTDKEKTLTSSGDKSVTTLVANETNVQMLLTVGENGNVTVAPAPGFESRNIKNSSDASTYTGSFDEGYQRDKGVFKLNYTYTDGNADNPTIYTVSEEIKFWL